MGITKNQSFFDPAAPTEGDIGGNYLLGADGTVLGNTGDALKVDIGAVADLDIRDLSASQDNVAISDGTDTMAVNADGSINSVVTATDLDIRNLAFATDTVDVSGSSVTVSATDLDIRDLTHATDSVKVGDGTEFLAINADGSINTKQATPAAIKNTQQTVTTSAAALAATPLSNRTSILIQNLGSKDAYIGQDNSVTSSNGVVIPAGSSAEFPWGPSIVPYAITASSTADVRLLETA